ncbi:hypothetical protein Tco_0200257 [Tanacetum coccineum]
MSQPANDEFSQHLSDDEASNHEDASDTGVAPKQQQQVIPQITAISNIKLPILKKKEYDIWAMEMEHYLEYIDNDIWKAKNILLMGYSQGTYEKIFMEWMMQKKLGSHRTSLVVNANSKKNAEGLDAHGVEVSTKDVPPNLSLTLTPPPTWSMSTVAI